MVLSALAVTDFNENILKGAATSAAAGNRSHRTPIPLGRSPQTTNKDEKSPINHLDLTNYKDEENEMNNPNVKSVLKSLLDKNSSPLQDKKIGTAMATPRKPQDPSPFNHASR